MSSEFIKIFNGIARHKNRYTVFSDFVTISIHNAVRKDEALEKEYMSIIAGYSNKEIMALSQLLAELIMLLEPEPIDILGDLFMSHDLGNKGTGQFLPHHLFP